jgi:hypothetical protein
MKFSLFFEKVGLNHTQILKKMHYRFEVVSGSSISLPLVHLTPTGNLGHKLAEANGVRFKSKQRTTMRY